jgi:hypothetical protein
MVVLKVSWCGISCGALDLFSGNQTSAPAGARSFDLGGVAAGGGEALRGGKEAVSWTLNNLCPRNPGAVKRP